ncbi:MAG: SDR family oxidoreductase [Ignavibacteriae bacterium]|nr:SDR family oxidoreductase [Ignavibacteriota bacterium]
MTTHHPTALITGASSGIGSELAHVFAEHGYNLVLVARRESKLQQLASDLQSKHRTTSWIFPIDLFNPNSPDELHKKITVNGLTVDVLVNNAGIGTYGKFTETDLECELQLMQLNIVTLTHLTKLIARDMLSRGSGKILNVASTAAFQPGPLMAVYYASKAYVVSFSNALAAELNGTGVSVTVLCPGPTATEFQEKAKMNNVRLFSRILVMDARAVAEAGFHGLMKGKMIVIPGIINKTLVQIQRFVPRKFPILVAKFLQEGRQ